MISVTFSFGAGKPCCVVVDCPIEETLLRRYQRSLHRVGVTLTVVEMLNWGFRAATSLDLQPIAATLVRLHNVDLAELLPVIALTLSEMASELQSLFAGRGVTCHVIDYSEGAMILEVKNVLRRQTFDLSN